MSLNTKSLIGSDRLPDGDDVFYAIDPRLDEDIEPAFAEATKDQVDRACSLAAQAYDSYARTTPADRATFLHSIAGNLEDSAEEIIARTQQETGLDANRLSSEMSVTTKQLRMFADLVTRGEWRRITLSTAGPGPDTRAQKIPVGPVAVFGASNFPLLYSVAGGDTASALAAGAPVVFKAHPSHPGSSALVGEAILAAARSHGLQEGVFALLLGAGTELGKRLVAHPAIKSVAFTGSETGGVALMQLGANRADPIPVFAEMTSVNPNLVYPHALRHRASELAAMFAGHVAAGAGQMCLTPGLIIASEGEGLDQLRTTLIESFTAVPAQTMINRRTHDTYVARIDEVAAGPDVQTAAAGSASTGLSASARLFETTGDTILTNPKIATEIFGPAAVFVRCTSVAQMAQVLESLRGQLTGTLHLDDEDIPLVRPIIPILERHVGRIIINGFSNELEVNDSSVHSGPFPATSDPRFTSVGTLAVERFLRPVSYQNFPDGLLPEPLRDRNTFLTPRLVNGTLELPDTVERTT
jgi:alpha-ketoglutaric semialdehyde dehydrogenase